MGSGKGKTRRALSSQPVVETNAASPTPQGKLYHVAPRSARDDILSYGIEAADPHRRWSLRSESPLGVYLWKDLAAAKRWLARQDLEHPLSEEDDIWEVSLLEHP